MKTIKQMMITIAVLLCSVTASAYDFVVDGIYYNILSASDLTVAITYKGDSFSSFSNEYSGEIIIPETVVYKSKVLKVTSIEDNAFRDCSALTSVTIGNSVTSIGDNAFENCYGLKKVKLNCKTIESWFAHSSIEEVIIGNSVTGIGDYAFSGCWYLTNIVIPDSVTSIGKSAFSNCSKLTSITIPNSVTSIGNYAFSDCSGLTSIEIPNSITRIGMGMFSDCSALTSVVIGKSVTSIEWKAFEGCTGLTNIHILSETPPTVQIDNFAESQYTDITLYVPVGSLETYKTADTWKNFWDIREEGTTETPEEDVKKCAIPVITYNNSGLDITTKTDGAEIHTNITCNDANSYNSSRIDLSATYSITTYATKSGYLNSDTATATLCWIAVSGSSEENSIIEVEAMPVLITCNNSTINICGGKEGAEVVVYTTSGVAVGNATITNGNVAVSTGLAKGEIAVVSIAGKGIKVVMQ